MDNRDLLLILSGAVILYLLKKNKPTTQQANKTVTLENNASATIDNGDQYKVCFYSAKPIQPELLSKNANFTDPNTQQFIRLQGKVLNRKIIAGIPNTI
jgi:hypothetical protein